ncbi:MAG: L-histidine N(alpha)-methyltransferase [Caulobacteraceae bacterium]
MDDRPETFASGVIATRTAASSVTLYDFAPIQESFADALLKGLSQPDRSIPARFLYDEAGSHLFDRICELPEYYPTRTELSILRDRATEIAAVIGKCAALVEFGAGSSQKARLVLDALDQPVAYVPIDISRQHLIQLAEEIAADHPALQIAAVCADYTQPLELPEFSNRARRVGFFPGSTIGNLPREEARAFLAAWAPQLSEDGAMIVGVDLKKSVDIVLPAYDDSQGVTAAFSLNVLARANREAAADFDLSAFRHHVAYDPASGRVAIHLESLRDQDVTVAGQRFHFRAGEKIHVEDSNKYTIEGFQALAREAGYTPEAVWTDPKGLFSVHALRVA